MTVDSRSTLPETDEKAGIVVSDVCSTLVERSYVADLIPDPDEDDQPIKFDVIYNPANEGQPLMVASDLGADTHHTLEEVLFWNLIIDEPHISEAMEAQIIADFSNVPNNQAHGAAGGGNQNKHTDS